MKQGLSLLNQNKAVTLADRALADRARGWIAFHGIGAGLVVAQSWCRHRQRSICTTRTVGSLNIRMLYLGDDICVRIGNNPGDKS